MWLRATWLLALAPQVTCSTELWPFKPFSMELPLYDF